MVNCIDEHRANFGVELICAVLPIAPSVYYEQRCRQRDTDRCPLRVRRDRELCGRIRVCGTPIAKSTAFVKCGSNCGGRATPSPADRAAPDAPARALRGHPRTPLQDHHSTRHRRPALSKARSNTAARLSAAVL